MCQNVYVCRSRAPPLNSDRVRQHTMYAFVLGQHRLAAQNSSQQKEKLPKGTEEIRSITSDDKMAAALDGIDDEPNNFLQDLLATFEA